MNTLTEQERQLLIELLEEEVRDLRSENYHAESHEVKEMLKGKEALAKGLLERLRQATGSES